MGGVVTERQPVGCSAADLADPRESKAEGCQQFRR